MTKYQLTQWEAIELFSKVVSKYERIDINKFTNNDFLVRYLIKYSSIKLSEDFSMKNWPQVTNKAGETLYPRALYELSQEIRFLQPVVRSANRLFLLLNYVGEEYSITRYRTLSNWNPDDKQQMFANTSWFLYYYEDYIDMSTATVQVGVTKAIVELLPFARLLIKDINATQGEPGLEQQFEGTYSVYGGGKFLLLEGRTKEFQEKDLHILLYIGTDRFEVGSIALGQYHDVGQLIYSGTVIMEKIDPTMIPKNDLNPKFYRYKEHGIEDVIWEYFSDKFNNRMRTQLGITRKETLQNWLKGQNRTDNASDMSTA